MAKNLMYIEAVADIDRGHWEVGREGRGELTSLQKKRQKKEVSEGGRNEGGRKERKGERRMERLLEIHCFLTFALSISGVG